jgi:hypothetical protein
LTCTVRRNSQGNIIKVLDKRNKESKLFKSIASHISINNSEVALDVYKNVYANDLKDIEESEMILSHRVNGIKYISFKDALLNTKEKSDILIGIEAIGKFIELFKVTKNTDLNNEIGFIQSNILNNNISDKKIKVGTDYFYEAFGNTLEKKQASLAILKEQASINLGSEALKIDNNVFLLEKTLGFTTLYNKNGEKLKIKQSELNQKTDVELLNNFDNAVQLITENEFKKTFFKSKPAILKIKKLVKEDSELVKNLITLLKKMNIGVIPMTNYITNYTLRHGVNPKAEALADVTNQIIAITDGSEKVENLLEETIHFIIEALPQEKIEDILRNIPKSEEYKKHYQILKSIYEVEYSQDELENVVRREILGKIAVNSILQVEDKTQTQENFFENIKRLISEFFQDIINYFKPEYKVELNGILSDIRDLIQTQDISDLQLDNFKGNIGRYYNIALENTAEDNKLFKTTQNLINLLTDQEKSLRKTNIKNFQSLNKLEQIQSELSENIQVNSVAGLVLVAKSRIAELKAAIKESNKNNSLNITVEEKIIFDSLTKKIQPELSAIKTIIKENKTGKNWEDLNKSIESTVSDIIDISAEVLTIDNQNTEKITNELIERLGIQNSNLIKDSLKVVKKDTNLLLSIFGQISAARDGMLNLLGFLTTSMTTEANSEFVNRTKDLQKIMSDNNITAQDFKLLVDNGFIISKYDFPKFKAEMDSIFLKKYREYSKSELKDEEILELRRNKSLEQFGTKQLQYEKELKSLQDNLKERAFKDEYYIAYEEKMQKANISKVTKDYLSGYFSTLVDIKLKSTKIVNGSKVTDYSLLSFSDRERQKELQQDRRMAKSYFDTSGNLKEGLIVKKDKDGLNILDENNKIIYELTENPSTEAIISVELNRLDALNDYSGLDMTNGIPVKFLNELRNIDENLGREEALDFLKMNSYIGFKSEFWDNLGKNKKITEKLRESLLNGVDTEQIKELINNIENKNETIKAILKVFVNKNSPIEVDTDRIPSDAKDKIKIIQQSLEVDFKNAKKYVRNIEDVELDNIGEEAISTTNQAWRNLLDDYNLTVDESNPAVLSAVEEILKLVKENTTFNNRDIIDSVNINIRQFRNNISFNVSDSIKIELEKQGLTQEDLKDDWKYAKFITTYAENKLLPYYKRFAPISYNTFNENLEETEDIIDFISNLHISYPSLEITPNFSYFEVQDNKLINPNFDTTFVGGYSQPKLDKFKSSKFYELFGDDKGTKNPNLFKVYEAMIAYRLDTLEANGAGKDYNAYMLPQTRKGKVEKLTNFLNSNVKQNTINAIQDIFNFTEDEQVKGDSNYNSLIKTIPQMFLSEIEPSDVSTELFYSLTLSAKESYLRKSRIKYYSDIVSTLDTMQGRDYSGTGKITDATNTMKMARSAVDYSLFGIKENSTAPIKTPFGTIDAAKMARNLLRYVKLKNLGLNVVIPFTSYATAKLNVWTETYIGQYLHKRSHKLGQAEYARKWRDGMKELGKIDTKADINVYGQHYKSFDIEESFKNSNYNIFGRGLVRSPMALHAMANYPIYGANMYSILHDYRFVDGKLQNFNSFRESARINNKTRQEIQNSWNTLEDKVIYKYTQNNKGKFEYKEDLIALELGIVGEELKQEITKINNIITNQIVAVNSFIDGSISQEEKTFAQRDAYLSYLTTHKGWLTIATQRRFKSRHINLQTGQEEEGSYNSFWNFLGDYIKEFKDSGLSGMILNFKRAYEKADDIERANIIRVGKEFLILNSVVALLMLLKSFADDEDKKDIYSLQLATYLMYRISAETTSSSLGIGNNYTESLKSPLIGFDTIANLGNVVDLIPYVGDDEVTRGKYAGMTERAKFITTSFPGVKSLFDLYNINSTLNTYELYNEKNLDFTIGSSVLWAESEENK